MKTETTLAERVKAARAAAGMSQPEAAMASGLGLTTLRDIEQGRIDDPRISTIEQLERALGARLYVHGQEADTPSTTRGFAPADNEAGAAFHSSGAGLAHHGA